MRDARRQGDRRQADGGLPPDAGQAGRDRDALHQAVGRPRQVRRHLHANIEPLDQGADRGLGHAKCEEDRRKAGSEQHLLRGQDRRRRGADASTSRRSRTASATAASRGPSTASPAWISEVTLTRRQVPRRGQLAGCVQAGRDGVLPRCPGQGRHYAAGADHERGGAWRRRSTWATSLGDINRRRGEILDTSMDKGRCQIARLRSAGGAVRLHVATCAIRPAARRAFSMEPSHYAAVKEELADLPVTVGK